MFVDQHSIRLGTNGKWLTRREVISNAVQSAARFWVFIAGAQFDYTEKDVAECLWNGVVPAPEDMGHSTPKANELAHAAAQNAMPNSACYYCGVCASEVETHLDHVIPRCHGGPDHGGNLVLACRSCNLSKATRSYEGFRAEMARRFSTTLPVFFGETNEAIELLHYQKPEVLTP